MKIFLARGGSLAEDVTESILSMPGLGAGRMTAEELEGMLDRVSLPHPGERLAAAPDRVWPGWGFDPGKRGDARFLKPVPPQGWRYDEGSGTLYRPEAVPGDAGSGMNGSDEDIGG